ncbi:hypothetical protein RBU61_08450 [Tissierella sp. MB52-C2]|uniref:exodeoxyribonuclease X C-terminal domain-containing protein n=1 Tax=Tissierella sp. MB52-C2 TaxID=3070999 RepID=UPI00280A82E9|nr:hypothetical protein [Tissierella sp. MB52-C2]WMM26695.1 hypothetical protein RBU61_08450 [Tissierella sp. MB52-C2]
MSNNLMMSLIESVEVSSIVGTLNKITQIQAAVQSQLKSGHDYDVIPGTSKPTLLKPGGEKILMMFGLTSEYEFMEKIEDYDKGIFAYTMKCILSQQGRKITEGVGSCNSKEDKYRWRWYKEEDLPVGIDKDSLKSKINRWGKAEYKLENEEIYSQANTILKMAKKRAQIDAVLTVASLSELFTQDMEDMKEFIQQEQVSTMTEVESKNIKLTFGKHKGKTLEEVYKEAPDYIKWLLGNDRTDPVIKKACEMLVSSPKKEPSKEKEAVNMETGEIEDIPAEFMDNPFDGEDNPF